MRTAITDAAKAAAYGKLIESYVGPFPELYRETRILADRALAWLEKEYPSRRQP